MLEGAFKGQVKTVLEGGQGCRLVAESRQKQDRDKGMTMKGIQEGEGSTLGE